MSASDAILHKDLQERILKKCWEQILVLPDLKQPCEESYNDLAELLVKPGGLGETNLSMAQKLGEALLPAQLHMRIFLNMARLGTANNGGKMQTPNIDRMLAGSDGLGFLQTFKYHDGEAFPRGNFAQIGLSVRADIDTMCDTLSQVEGVDKEQMARCIANFKRFAKNVESSGVLEDMAELARRTERKRGFP